MNKDGVTVTLPLEKFDELREGERAYREIAPRIARCFEYECKELVVSEDCKKCVEENPDCTTCDVYKANPPFKETLTVDVERLISVCKDYAFYGKEIPVSDPEEMEIIKKSGGKSTKRGCKK